MDEAPAATSATWKNNPMPAERQRFDVAIAISPEEFSRVKLGHVLDSMEDRWFIYFEDGRLNFHRSWTGNCIYRLRFEPSGNEYIVTEAWVNRNPVDYKYADDEADKRLVGIVIRRILLEQKS